MPANVVVVGSSNTDIIARVRRIPRPGETILGDGFATAAGGKGANQAVAAARAGGKVLFVARVGRDAFGEAALSGWDGDGSDTRYVYRDRAHPSGVALIFVARSGENSIAVVSGANARLSPQNVRKARKSIIAADVLVTQLESPPEAVREAVELAAAAGVPVVLNPAPAKKLPRRLLRLISVLTPNESEAELLTGVEVKSKRSAAAAALELRRQGVQTVIVTLGARGAFVSSPEGEELIPAFKVKPVDTTAAGDAFNGALAVTLGEDVSLMEAVRFANGAAALSVTRFGAQSSAPQRSEIRRFLASNVP